VNVRIVAATTTEMIVPPGLRTLHERSSVSPPTVSNTTSTSLTNASKGACV
jgi:hypothetical protein